MVDKKRAGRFLVIMYFIGILSGMSLLLWQPDVYILLRNWAYFAETYLESMWFWVLGGGLQADDKIIFGLGIFAISFVILFYIVKPAKEKTDANQP